MKINKGKIKGSVKSKTQWLSLVLIVGGIIQANIGVLDLSSKAMGWCTMGFGILFAILRWFTNKPLDAK